MAQSIFLVYRLVIIWAAAEVYCFLWMNTMNSTRYQQMFHKFFWMTSIVYTDSTLLCWLFSRWFNLSGLALKLSFRCSEIEWTIWPKGHNMTVCSKMAFIYP